MVFGSDFLVCSEVEHLLELGTSEEGVSVHEVVATNAPEQTDDDESLVSEVLTKAPESEYMLCCLRAL